MPPIEVHVAAPNDIDDTVKLFEPRRAYIEDLVRRCDGNLAKGCVPMARCLVVRHRPKRDEDNT